jgi:hypothetical protein
VLHYGHVSCEGSSYKRISETFMSLLCSPITHPSRESGISLSDAMGAEVHGWM